MGLELEKQDSLGFMAFSGFLFILITICVFKMEPTIDNDFYRNAFLFTVVYLYCIRAINSRFDGDEVLKLIEIVEKSVKQRDKETQKTFNLMFGTFLPCKTYSVEYAEENRAKILNFAKEYEINHIFEHRYV